MKNILFLFALFFFLMFISCKKSKVEPITFSATPAMSAKVNGSEWTASSLNASLIYGTPTELNVNGGQMSDNEIIYLALRNYSNSPGAYYVGNGNQSYAFYEKDGQTIYYAEKGQVVIVNVLAGLIQGTYNFTTTNGITITGTFTVAPFISH